MRLVFLWLVEVPCGLMPGSVFRERRSCPCPAEALGLAGLFWVFVCVFGILAWAPFVIPEISVGNCSLLSLVLRHKKP